MMDTVIGRDELLEGKPAPDAYIAALRATSLQPSEVVAVEDTPVSALAAKRAGLQVILTPGAFARGIEEAEADLVVKGLATEEGKLAPEVGRLVGLTGQGARRIIAFECKSVSLQPAEFEEDWPWHAG